MTANILTVTVSEHCILSVIESALLSEFKSNNTHSLLLYPYTLQSVPVLIPLSETNIEKNTPKVHICHHPI